MTGHRIDGKAVRHACKGLSIASTRVLSIAPQSGRFGFVEMRSEELASSAMQLDKVDVCGRQINVGRPKGYVEPPGGAAPAATLNAAQVFAASLARRASTVLLLENMLLAYQLHDDRERNDVSSLLQYAVSQSRLIPFASKLISQR